MLRTRIVPRGWSGIAALTAVVAWSLHGCVPQGNGGKLTGKYVGAAKCKECHEARYNEWAATSHAGALDTLDDDGHGTDPDCLGCHVVAFLEDGGYVDRAKTNALAGVQCENCHGAGRQHAEDPNNESLRLPKSIAGGVCGQCHTGCECHRGTTHPNYQLWADSKHSQVEASVAADFANGEKLDECGECHSGDYRRAAIIEGQSVGNDMLAGKSASEMNGVTCVICHNPHRQTGNAEDPYPGWDYQLRYKQAVDVTASNSIQDASDASRFNLCGQCHHGHGRTWQEGESGPHDSVQINVITGEMPMPAGQEATPLVDNHESQHAEAVAYCATCHMHTKDEEGAPTPTEGGHTFKTYTEGCNATDCHSSVAEAVSQMVTLQEEVQTDLDDIADRLGDPNAWEYTEEGGPDAAGQAALSDAVKKARFLYHYVMSDGSLGVHNPEYVRAMLVEADDLLTSVGK